MCASPNFCYGHDKVPVTSFFGSVMKTVHTDAAYTGVSMPSEMEGSLFIEDGEHHRIMLEKEPNQENLGNEEAKVCSLR